MKSIAYYEELLAEEGPWVAAGETRSFPNVEGKWKLVSTGETVNAIEQKDIYDDPIFAIFIGEEGPFYSIDMENETFEKL
jgi:hypothetical protein